MHECWASCTGICLGICLLERQVEPALVAAGFLISLLCSVLGLQFAESVGLWQRIRLEGVTKCIKATSNALTAVKEVTMSGLQVVMER